MEVHSNADALLREGVELLKLGQYEEALTKLTEAAGKQPHSHELFNYWGVALSKLGRYEEACEKFAEAVVRCVVSC